MYSSTDQSSLTRANVLGSLINLMIPKYTRLRNSFNKSKGRPRATFLHNRINATRHYPMSILCSIKNEALNDTKAVNNISVQTMNTNGSNINKFDSRVPLKDYKIVALPEQHSIKEKTMTRDNNVFNSSKILACRKQKKDNTKFRNKSIDKRYSCNFPLMRCMKQSILKGRVGRAIVNHFSTNKRLNVQSIKKPRHETPKKIRSISYYQSNYAVSVNPNKVYKFSSFPICKLLIH